MTLSIAKPFVSIFKKSKSKSNKGTINTTENDIGINNEKCEDNKIIEEIYTIQYQITDEGSCRGASPEVKYIERTIKINEDGVYLYDKDQLTCHWGFVDIKEFSLDHNWSDWIIILRDGSKHYFKSYEALQVHLKMNEIVRKLVSRVSSSSL
ncbi:hypothetical protein DICPUDRAFT_99421 [Dictyostelium purpureum]|uniref:Uncharacterized protein n=1 Tax=Dictyostelium purpureum TaxID=5786 RepID=F0ZZ32_DICPU|nr:uncharacterized protein DICPUDRAFT_99421 [Dictyostelium purpureum]EGC30786.1 hypothetical protein DICPUDRAFT_99421 [Dictyostelium purpureum]|eukprot:XP_003292676.1 hypothetical protein DICPUDRAFT_99421 [Dictyostelium purpureum]